MVNLTYRAAGELVQPKRKSKREKLAKAFGLSEAEGIFLRLERKSEF